LPEPGTAATLWPGAGERHPGFEALLDAQHLNDDPLPPLAIELGIEDALPGSQVEFPVGDRRRDFLTDTYIYVGRVGWAARAGVNDLQ